MIYTRAASPLHATRAGVAVVWCLALALAALLLSNPLALGTLCVSVVAVGWLSGVGRQLRRVAVCAVPLGLTVAAVNALLTRDGLTVIARLGDLPVLSTTNVTLEATVYGAILGLRAVTLILCAAIYSLAVDPDAVLVLMRRLSFRSALTASIANRMVPVLMRDSRRLADAQRCRPGRHAGRVVLMRAATSGVLDRALDMAAALEVRGYGVAWAGSGRRSARAPWSRHDLAFALSAAAIIAIAIGARAGGVVAFTAYPTLSVSAGPAALGVSLLLAACVLAPFADRRGVQ
jgi:energy-coupling factor transport system permease protein